MTRIRFKVKRAIALLQMLVALFVLFPFITQAELEFFQDEESEVPEVSVQRLMRYLDMKRRSHQNQHLFPPAAAPLQDRPSLEQLEMISQLQEQERQKEYEEAHLKQLHKQHLFELAKQKQRGILRDDLPERPDVLDVLQRESVVDPLVYVHELDRQRLLPYLGLEYQPDSRFKAYSVEEETRVNPQLLPAPMSKDPLLDYPETHYEDIKGRARHHLENPHLSKELQHNHRPVPIVPFTYNAPKVEPVDLNAPPPFAVRPNDPRYFENDDTSRKPSRQEHNGAAKHKHVEHVDKVEHKHEPISELSTAKPKQKVIKVKHEDDSPRSNYVQMNMLPEPQRRAEQDPMVVSLDYKNNNDVYFIAVVAGCSAAAMFALVLISLTWCKLQRYTKAAADVEYPAYGVTGPNKDMSPSGDQRLAQSAQMYHFQHQKQQIIAMENRASAARDPGSVSEAESDEENEEGDYTVYECPGLAPTAEMEVKNPLFDDDPTPATPSKSKRNGDI